MKSSAENLKKMSYFFFTMAIVFSGLELLINLTGVFRSLLGNGFHYSFVTQQISVYFLLFIVATPITFVASIYLKHFNNVNRTITPEDAELKSKKITKKYAITLIAFTFVSTLFDFLLFYKYDLNQLIFLEIVGVIVIVIAYLERWGKLRGSVKN